MNETELERLVVRLTGDASSYLKMLKDAEDRSKATAESIEAHGKKMEGVGDTLKGLGTGIVEAIGGEKVLEFLKEAKSEWQTAETAAFRLNSVLKSNGRDVKEVSANYAEFASNLQKTTTYSDEQVMSLLKTAEMFDLTGASAKKATKDAMALGAATDTSAEAAMRLVAAMTSGDTERAQMYARMIPQLRGVKDEAEFTAKYQKLITAGQQTLSDELTTGAGRAKNFANRWSDMMEEVGKTHSQVANPVKVLQRTLMEIWDSLNPKLKEHLVLVATWSAHLVKLLAVATVIAAVWPQLAAGLALIKTQLIALAANPLTWAILAATVLTLVAAKATGLTSALSDMNKEVERANKTQADWEKMEARVTEGRVRKANDIKDPGQKDAYIADQTKKTQAELERWKKKVEEAKSVRDEWFPSIERYQEAGREMRHAESMVTSLRDRIDQLNQKRNEASTVVTEMAKKIDEETRSLSMDKRELEQYELALKGATKAKKEFIKAKQNDREAQSIAKELDEMIRSAVEEFETSGMDAGEAAAYKIRVKISELSKQLKDAAGDAKERLEGDIRDLKSKLEAAEAFRERADLEAKAKDIREQFKDPAVKAAEAEAELKDMLDQGMITREQYNKALDDTIKKLQGVAAATRDAAEAGSAEARSRINETLDAQRGQTRFGQNPGKANVVVNVPMNEVVAELRDIKDALADMDIIRMNPVNA